MCVTTCATMTVMLTEQRQPSLSPCTLTSKGRREDWKCSGTDELERVSEVFCCACLCQGLPVKTASPVSRNSFPLLPSYWRRECKLHHISSWGGSYTMQGKENLVRADQLARGCACPLHHARTHTHTHLPFLSVCQPPPLFCLEGAVKSRVEGRFCFCLCSYTTRTKLQNFHWKVQATVQSPREPARVTHTPHMLLAFFFSLKGRLQIRLGDDNQVGGAYISSRWVGDTEAGGKNGKKAAPLPFVIYCVFF